ITEVIQSASTLPDAGAWGCESSVPTSQYVAEIETDATGKITVTSRNIKNMTNGTAEGGAVTLKPYDVDGNAPAAGTSIGKWVCGNTTDGTTIDAKFLPGSCRGQ